MTNLHPSKGTTTPGTALMPKHAGWAAAQAGKKAWIIDGNAEQSEFEYNCTTIKRMHYVRRNYCEALRKGNTL